MLLNIILLFFVVLVLGIFVGALLTYMRLETHVDMINRAINYLRNSTHSVRDNAYWITHHAHKYKTLEQINKVK